MAKYHHDCKRLSDNFRPDHLRFRFGFNAKIYSRKIFFSIGEKNTILDFKFIQSQLGFIINYNGDKKSDFKRAPRKNVGPFFGPIGGKVRH